MFSKQVCKKSALTLQSSSMKLNLVTVLAFGVGVTPVVFAVERPVELDEKPHELKTVIPQETKTLDLGESGSGQQEFEKPFLGVGSQTVDETLALHLGLKSGVVVKQVHPGSGAEGAGLLVHDIILSLDGAQVDSPQVLRDTIQQCEVNEEVTVVLIREGKTEERVVTLGPRPTGVPGIDQLKSRGVLGGLKRLWPEGNQFGDAQEQMERLEEMLDGDLKGVGIRLHDHLNDLFDGDLPKDGSAMNFDFDMGSSVTWADPDGDVTMKKKNGKTEVTVRDREGKVVYDGPWETEDEKSAVEPEIRKRIEKLGVQEGGQGFQFWLDEPSEPVR